MSAAPPGPAAVAAATTPAAARADVDAFGREKLRAYKLLRTIGSGGFADVSEYEHVATGEHVAIKRVRKTAYADGVNIGAVKELQALAELTHGHAHAGQPSHSCGCVHVCALHDVWSYGDRVHLVLDLAECDLTSVIRDPRITITEADVKGYMLAILRGLAFIHSRQWMHRDIKPDNVLISRDGSVKVADFGHAARVEAHTDARPIKDMHHNVVTIWYRAPELLLHGRSHGPAVDVWAAGCVLAEMLLRQPLFPSNESEADQLAHIYRLLGTPVDPVPAWTLDPADAAVPAARPLRVNGFADVSIAAAMATAPMRPPLPAVPRDFTASNVWPFASCLPAWCEYEPRQPQPWRTIMAVAPVAHSSLVLDLLSKMVVMDPSKRISVKEVLSHPWFSSEPWPTAAAKLPRKAKS